MNNLTSMKWYVIKVVGEKEKKIKEYIENGVKASNLDYLVGQVLIPTEKTFQIKNGKKISRERNFYPGYILIEAELTGELKHLITNTTNVSGFLTDRKGGEPVPLRDYEVDKILGRVDKESEKEEESIITYKVGDAVKVTDGPFNGFKGVIVDNLEDKRKLKVTVKIFGRETSLELSYGQVEKEN